jgi:ABC-type multidrug transport system ATPase subunit
VFKPELVVFDEPTAGLDVQSRHILHQIIKEIQAEGATIILATHDMAEAEKLADRVTIIARGSIVANGTPRELKRWLRAVERTGTGTASSMAAVIVQRPSPESDTRPANSLRSGSSTSAVAVRSSNQEAMTLPRRHSSVMSRRLRSYW